MIYSENAILSSVRSSVRRKLPPCQPAPSVVDSCQYLPVVPGAARATALSSLSAGQSIIKEIYNLEERAFYDRSLHAALINIFTVNYPLCTQQESERTTSVRFEQWCVTFKEWKLLGPIRLLLLTAEVKDGEERNLSDRDRKGKKQEVPWFPL